METIAYTINGQTTEVSLSALGAGAHLRIAFKTHEASKVTIDLATLPPEFAAPIPFEAQSVLYTGRTAIGQGGTILFQGRRTDNPGNAGPTGASQQLVIEDAWYDLRFITLQALWQNVVGYNPGPVYGPLLGWPDCVLFQASPAGMMLPNGQYQNYAPAPVQSHITTGQSIREILAYAIFVAGVNLQIGEIDPACYVPFYPVRSMRCADAIKIALRVHPDCACEIDYTTTNGAGTPCPTFNVRQRSNLAALTLPYKGSVTANSVTRKHISSKPRPRPDLQVPRVAIYLKETTTINGNDVISLGSDIYPAGSQTQLRSLDASVDLTGPKLAKTVATLTTAMFDPTNLQWWQQKVPSLKGPPNGQTQNLVMLDNTINGGITAHPQGLQVVDDSGNAINLETFSYELTEGTPAAWMEIPAGGQLQWIEAQVTALFTYEKVNSIPGSNAVDKHTEHQQSVRVKLINVPTTTFSLTQTLNTGEGYPGGLAQSIFQSLAQLQFDFTHSILETPFATVIKPGKHALNVSGGSPQWLEMNAMIESVELDLVLSPVGPVPSPGVGNAVAKTTVQCGPVKHLETGELIQLFNIFANRDLSRINPNERLSGVSQSGGQVQLGSDSPKENSVPAPPVPSENNNVVTANGQVTGQTIQSAPMVAAITTGKTPANGATPQTMITMQPREFAVCDNTGNVYYAAIQATQGHTPA